MAKFKYTMESILNLRVRIEDLKKQEFGDAIKILEEEKAILKIFTDKKENSVIEFREKVKSNIDPEEPKLFHNYIEALKIKIKKQKIKVDEATKFVEIKRQELIIATQEKKKLEKLRENEFEDYMVEEKRNEQKITDEIVSYQYHE